MNVGFTVPTDAAGWLTLGATHAAVASLLAAVVWVFTRVWKDPHAGRVLWLGVVLKLACPPLVAVALLWPASVPNRDRQGASRVASPSPAAPTAPAVAERVPTNRDRQGAPRPAPPSRPLPTVDVPTVRTAPLPATESRKTSTGTLPDGRGSWSGALVLPAVWTAGAALLWLLAAVRSVRFGTAIRRLPDGDERLTRLLATAAARMNVAVPALKVSPNVGPLVWAGPFGRATVVVPGPLFDALPDRQAAALLAHECAHLARRDHLVRWLELLACGLWWWLPTAWLAAAAGRRCEELCCDAAVLAAGREERAEEDGGGDVAAAYAEALLAAAAYLSEARRPAVPASVPVPASGVGRPRFLRRRFEMILQDKLPPRPGRRVRWPLTAAALLAAVVGVSVAGPPGEEPAGEAPTRPAAEPTQTRDEPTQTRDEPTQTRDEPTEAADAAGPATDGRRTIPLRRVVDGANRLYARFGGEAAPLTAARVKEIVRDFAADWRARAAPYPPDVADLDRMLAALEEDALPVGGVVGLNPDDGPLIFYGMSTPGQWAVPLFGDPGERYTRRTLGEILRDYHAASPEADRPVLVRENVTRALRRALGGFGPPDGAPDPVAEALARVEVGGLLPTQTELKFDGNAYGPAPAAEFSFPSGGGRIGSGGGISVAVHPTGQSPEERLELPPAAPDAGPTLGRLVERFNMQLRDQPPLTVEEVRAAMRRDLEQHGHEDWAADWAEAFRGYLAGDDTALRVRELVVSETVPPIVSVSSGVPKVGGGTMEISTRVRGGLSDTTRAKIAAALAAAATDDALPVATRLKLLRESIEPGGLTGEQNARLAALLVEGMTREQELQHRMWLVLAGLAGEESLGEDWPPVGLNFEAKVPLIEMMAALGATAPGEAAAFHVAVLGAERDGDSYNRRDSQRAAAATVLNRTAGSADGLRGLLAAARRPAPELPANFPDAIEGPETDDDVFSLRRLQDEPADHRRAVDLLLDTVRRAKPATDEAAAVLLEAASSDDPAVRAAAVEALAAAAAD